MSHEMAFEDGLLAAQAGKRVLARLQFEQADELSPNNPDYALWLAWTADSPTHAAQILADAAKTSPENEMLWAFKSIMEAMSQFQSGRDYSHFLLELIDASTHRAEHASFVAQEGQPEAGEVAQPAAPESAAPESAAPESAAPERIATDNESEVEEVAPESNTPYRQLAETIDYAPHEFDETTETIDYHPHDLDGTTEPIEYHPRSLDDAAEFNSKPIEELRPDPGHQKKVVTNAPFGPADTDDELLSQTEADQLEALSQSQHSRLPDFELSDVEIDTNELEEYDAFADELEQTAAAVIQQVGEIQDEVDDALLEAESGLAQTQGADTTPDESQPPPERNETQASTAAAAAPLPPSERPSAKSNAILVVDDSPTVLKLVSMTLSGGGYEVKTADNGVDALKMLVNFTPSLILLDVKMPRMDGYKLCKLIKRDEQLKQIPIVMLSDKDGMFDKLRGSFVGCTDYITKPFESADLLEQVRKYLSASSD